MRRIGAQAKVLPRSCSRRDLPRRALRRGAGTFDTYPPEGREPDGEITYGLGRRDSRAAQDTRPDPVAVTSPPAPTVRCV